MLARFRGSSIRFFPEFPIVKTLHSNVASRLCVARSISAKTLNRMAIQRFQKLSARARHAPVFTLLINRETPIFHKPQITCRFRSGRN